MIVKFDFAALKQATVKEFAVRFVLGGSITVATGLIAKKYGPAVGGLFLAFPAIFPAAATLVSTEEREKKERLAMHGRVRGRLAAGLEARGAAIGSIGLGVFCITVWSCIARSSSIYVLAGATLLWLATSASLWYLMRRLR